MGITKHNIWYMETITLVNVKVTKCQPNLKSGRRVEEGEDKSELKMYHLLMVNMHVDLVGGVNNAL